MRTWFPPLLVALGACGSDSGLERVNAPPTAEILAPEPGSVFRQGGGAIVLAGLVADSFDVPVALAVSFELDAATEVNASVDADGAVSGTLADDLALGEHLLDLLVTDVDGASARASSWFTVLGPVGAPTVAITAPADGTAFAFGSTVTFTGTATDLATAADDLAFAWRSSLDGALAGAISGDGASAVLAALSEGTHVVTLEVTDGDGEVGSDSISVVVEPEGPVEPEPGDLIFSEMMVNPDAVADEMGEWVELYNTSGSTLDIEGYALHDDDSDYWVFEESIEVPPGGYVVLCANPDPALNGGVPCDGWFYRNPMGEKPPTGSGYGVAIANNDDELTLTSPSGVDIDHFDYNDTDSDPIEAGMAFGLDPSALDGTANDNIDNWCVQETVLPGVSEPGTPGAPNDACF